MEKSIVFFDTEIGTDDNKIHDIGAIRTDRAVFHGASLKDFSDFIQDSQYLAGHNIVHHDLVYIQKAMGRVPEAKIIDTLYLSPLLFPKSPYHRLVKDDKIQSDTLNNPVNDSKNSQKVFYDEVNAFSNLPMELKQIFCGLLYNQKEFTGFFDYMDMTPDLSNLANTIHKVFMKKICANADLYPFINHSPIELAYALALIDIDDAHSITPRWLVANFPQIDYIIHLLRNFTCQQGCSYCKENLNVGKALKDIFGYDQFRRYNGEPLQEKAAQAAVDNKSLLAVFPTGGGKSITFQLPALMAGKATHGLTVVISPLQSLMKDQVDNLNSMGITEAVTVNGLLDPIERSDSLERVKNGGAKLLYISPEQLRSKTIQSILRHRNIARFVIDEAHCFSAWGQDFRVDYLYIGDFIGELQKQKNGQEIPVSCFTATAKQKVITDICDYFKRKLGIELQIYASDATRENLHYKVLFKETDEEKYNELRNLLSQKNCSTIIYASRTKTTIQLAEKLTSDGFAALAFNGKMDTKEKIANQDAFMRNEVNIIVATSAFGMGVDKKDVKLVVHYDISDSLENYVQEAGRAGRDPSLQAECYVLFNDRDLDKHFVLLNQTKLSISEIQQVWKAVKDLTRQRSTICCSPLEIARQAGWDDSVNEIETRVKTAISALETAGYVKRGRNMPHVYANSILAKDMMDAAYRIDGSSLFSPPQRDHAKRIIKSLISSRSLSKMGNEDAESRVDYLADILGMTKEEVISAVNLMRQEGLLADSLDMSAYIMASDSENKSKLALDRFAKLERYLIAQYTEQGLKLNFKEINQAAQESGIGNSTVRNLKTLYYYHHIKGYVQRTQLGSSGRALPAMDQEKLLAKQQRRINICLFALDNLYQKAKEMSLLDQGETPVQFSLIGLLQDYKNTPQLGIDVESTTQEDLEDALLYLSKIGALKIEGGFLVIYNAMEIKRLILENRIRYKAEDYRFLDEFYKQKIRQIHIVGEYANLMVRNYQAALQFVKDYFEMDFKQFMAKYFVGKKAADIDRNITPQKYHELFDNLSDIQSQIINDAQSKYIVVAAGPGSGKTRVLVHKLASLLILEDVKHEQLLMVTFSRAAATEFKKRLIELIGPSANFVDIKTFHSYCFDLLGKIGSLEGVQNIVADAAEMIANGEVEPGKITKSVLVIDEAQDMDGEDFNLIKALMQANEDMRVIAVGDDDQNIYAFRGSDAKYFRAMIEDYGANKYEMVESYRSKSNIIDLSNAFLKSIPNRMKTDDIKGLQKENGRVLITRHRSKNMAQAVVDQVVETRENNKSCILTNTNDEALQVLGLLHQSGIRGKLIQSLDGFKLSNLVEIRYFLKVIDKKLKSPVISEELWAEGKSKLFETYKQSSSLEICNNLIRDFEQITREKYRSDLEEFINESNYEDFYNEDKESVLVSTIHKSKGREFDNVYLLLKDVNNPDPEELRKLYVGITRAKRNLYIHSNTPLFDQYQIEGIIHVQDHNIYQEPKEILLQLTHRDVVLDFFKDKKEKMFQLRSGDKLKIDHKYLLGKLNQQMVPLAKLSKGFCEKLERLQTKGYQPYQGEVRFVVAWKGEEDTAESAVLLPNIYLKKV